MDTKKDLPVYFRLDISSGFSLHELEGSLMHSNEEATHLAYITLEDKGSILCLGLAIFSCVRHTYWGVDRTKRNPKKWTIQGAALGAKGTVKSKRGGTPSFNLLLLRDLVVAREQFGEPIYFELEYDTVLRSGSAQFDGQSIAAQWRQ